jgi:hypothetical protein
MPVDVGQASSALVAFPTFSRSPMSVSHAHRICCIFWMRFVNGLLGRCGLLLKIRMPMSPQYSTAHTLQPGALRCHRTCSVSGSFPMEALSTFPGFPRDLTVRFGRLRQGTFQRDNSTPIQSSLHSGPHSIQSLATRLPTSGGPSHQFCACSIEQAIPVPRVPIPESGNKAGAERVARLRVCSAVDTLLILGTSDTQDMDGWAACCTVYTV